MKQKFKFIYCGWACGTIVVICECGNHYKVNDELYKYSCSKCKKAISYINKAHHEGWLPIIEQLQAY